MRDDLFYGKYQLFTPQQAGFFLRLQIFTEATASVASYVATELVLWMGLDVAQSWAPEHSMLLSQGTKSPTKSVQCSNPFTFVNTLYTLRVYRYSVYIYVPLASWQTLLLRLGYHCDD